MAILNGNRFRLYLGDDILTGELSSSISFTNQLIEVTKSDVGAWKEYEAGIKGASFSFENLYSFNDINIGDEFLVRFGTEDNGYEGNVIISDINIEATSDDVINFSGTAKVIGELEIYEPIHEFLLLEDDCFLLLEDECKIIIDIPDR